jgi:transketolase
MNMLELEKKALEIRKKVLATALKAGKGHVPPAFSWVEIGVALYYGGILHVDPRNPAWPERDRFLLSKGHACLTEYAILADLGFFPPTELDHFASDGSMLAGHPDPLIPGVEVISGSLGHGLGIGAGLALGARLNHQDWSVYVVLGDGECDEGSVWEAAMFASHHQLDHLVAIVDRNHLSATNFTEETLKLEPLVSRWQSFGWDARVVDGHSLPQLLEVLGSAHVRGSSAPLVVIADTVKGKGVHLMENSPLWHHRLPKGDEIEQAWRDLGGLVSEYSEGSR